MVARNFNRSLLVTLGVLVLGGLFIFTSASLGLLARENMSVVPNLIYQLAAALLGTVLLIGASKLNYHLWQKYSIFIFIAALLLTASVFIPGFGIEHGGARRWIPIGPLSFQPAEFLKLGFVLYFAACAARGAEKLSGGGIPLIALLALTGVVLLFQPNTSIFVIICLTGLGMFFVSGAKKRHLAILCCIGLLGFFLLAYERPYIKDRLLTFWKFEESNLLDEGYQIDQSLIAIGSGGFMGRGFGQSIQKFGYLPEPIGDSIFAVAAEEFGFIGSALILLALATFAVIGLRIASYATDAYGRLVVTGIVILITSQSLLNIAAMTGLAPLSGIPIVFMSKGGSALVFALLEVGIMLNVSKYQRIT